IAAYHSILIFDIIAKRNIRDGEIDEEDSENWHPIVVELHERLVEINEENYIEYYHDAIDYKEDILVLFNLGQVGLKDKANAELLFFKICKEAAMYAALDEVPSEELKGLGKVLSNKHIGNFSLFQSMVDSWAIDQLFPIIPIQNLDQIPNARGTIVDLTCDSDGEVKQFVIDDEIKDSMEFHSLSKEHPYYVAVPLVGAYQDTLGNYHNLLGSLNEVYVSITQDGDVKLDKVIKGDRVCDVLGYMHYDGDEIMDNFTSKVADLVQKDVINQNDADMISDYYRNILHGYTYFSPNGYAD
ncbi:MAG: biosynthetic arginine decarboxylase, partial [Methanosarcinales archaeon]|nr:biosynthetic arginine decarboxylase [Methanosarcinales archaeon]